MNANKKPLPLRAINHVSHICRDVAKTAAFYTQVLGFWEIKRPSSFDFDGAWLFGYGMGLHLIGGVPPARASEIIPKSDHLSFQADAPLSEVEACLKQFGIPYVKQSIEEAGVRVTQLFMHDPDENMIEICDCDQLPVIPLSQDTSFASFTGAADAVETLQTALSSASALGGCPTCFASAAAAMQASAAAAAANDCNPFSDQLVSPIPSVHLPPSAHSPSGQFPSLLEAVHSTPHTAAKALRRVTSVHCLRATECGASRELSAALASLPAAAIEDGSLSVSVETDDLGGSGALDRSCSDTSSGNSSTTDLLSSMAAASSNSLTNSSGGSSVSGSSNSSRSNSARRCLRSFSASGASANNQNKLAPALARLLSGKLDDGQLAAAAAAAATSAASATSGSVLCSWVQGYMAQQQPLSARQSTPTTA